MKTQEELNVMFEELQYQDIMDFYHLKMEAPEGTWEYSELEHVVDDWYNLVQSLGWFMIWEQDDAGSMQGKCSLSDGWIEVLERHGFSVLEDPVFHLDGVVHVVIPPITDPFLLKQLRKPMNLSWLTVSMLEASFKEVGSVSFTFKEAGSVGFNRWIVNQAGLSQEVQEWLKTMEEKLNLSNCKPIGSQDDGEPCTGDTTDEAYQVTDLEPSFA